MKHYLSILISISLMMSFIPVIEGEEITDNTRFYIFSEDFSEYGVTKNTAFRDYPKSLESTLNGGSGFSGKWSSTENEISDFTTAWPKLSTQLGGSAYGYGGTEIYRTIENSIDLTHDGEFKVEFTMSANTSDNFSGISLGEIKIGNCLDKALIEISDKSFSGEKTLNAKKTYTYVAEFNVFAENADKVSLYVYSEEGNIVDYLISECELGIYAINSIGMIFSSTPTYISEISAYEEFGTASKKTLVKKLEEILAELPEGTDYLTKDNYSEILNSAEIYVNKIKNQYGEDVFYDVEGYEKYYNSVNYNNSAVNYKVDLSTLYNSTIYASENSSTGENPNVVTGPNRGFEIDLFKAKAEWKKEWGEDEYNIYILDSTEYLMRVKGNLAKCAYRTAAVDRAVDVIDVKDGEYAELELLVNTDNTYYSSGKAYVGLVLQYSDGTRKLIKERIYNASEDRNTYQNQISGDAISVSDSVVGGTLYIHELKIPVDKNKKLTSIEVLQSYTTLNETMTDISGFEVTESTKQVYRATIYAMTLKQTVESLKEEFLNELNGLMSKLPAVVSENDAIYYMDVVNSIDKLLEEKSDGLFINFKELEKFSVYEELKKISPLVQNIDIYISPDGNDLNSGKETEPVKTLPEAVRRVENIRKKYSDTDINVIFYPGSYFIDKTVVMNEISSGSENGKVIYKALNNQKVILKGTVSLNKDNFENVTDEKILARLPAKSKEKVKVMDLTKEGITSFAEQSSGGYGGTGIKYNSLFADGQEKILARWPNYGYGNIKSIEDAEKRIISIDENLATRWVNAQDIVLDCFFSNDYACDKLKVTGVDSDNSTITVDGNVTLNSTASGRFYAYNLIEELDIPGEYYIEDGMLYYYPDGDFENLELSVVKDDFITIDNAEFIGFEGLTFEKSCGNIIKIQNSNNITIDDCDFNDVGRYSVYAENVTDVKVTNCDFYNLGNSAVTLDGGIFETLESSNNEISNCTFNRFSQFRRSYAPAVSISGVGAVVKNNVIHNSPHVAVSFNGNNHKILYNEIYDVCLETYDCGAIYGGKSLYKRGVEIAYNYIHDVKNEYFPKSTGQKGIYFDDRLSGGIIHNNIIVNSGEGIFVHGGQDMNIYENIVVECVRGIGISHCGFDGTAVFEEVENWIKENPIYLEKYPMLEYVSTRGDQHPRGNVVKDNLLVNAGEVYSSGYVELGEDLKTQSKIAENISKGSVFFTDPQNHNYTVTDEDILADIPGLSTIDISKIGLIGRVSDNDIVTFKKKQTMLQDDYALLSWNKVEAADYYKIVIATDNEFKNITEEAIAYGESYVISLEKGKPVFWKLYAIKDSLNGKDTLESDESATIIISPQTIIETDSSIDYLVVKHRLEQLFAKIPQDISHKELDKYKEFVDEAESLISLGFAIPISEITGIELYIGYKNAEVYSMIATEYEQVFSIIQSWKDDITAEYAYSKIIEYGNVLSLIDEISSKDYDVTELKAMPKFINMKNMIDSFETEFKYIDISDKFNAHIYADKNTSTLSNPNVITGDNFGFEINDFKSLPGWKYDWSTVTDYFNFLRFDGINFNMKVREGLHSNQSGRNCAWRTTEASESVFIDVEDGYYENISFLVNTDTKWFGTSHNTGYLGVIYVYDDGSEVLEYQNIYHGADDTGAEEKIACDKISTANEVLGKLYLYKHDFTPNSTKKLTGIKILQSYSYLNEDKSAVAGLYEIGGKQDFRATIYSITGEMISLQNIEKVAEIEDKINELPNKISISDIILVDEIEILLNEAYDIGIKSEDISNIEIYKKAQKQLEILIGIDVLNVDFGGYNTISEMAGKNITVFADVLNERYKDGLNAKCYMALFDENGALKDVKSQQILLNHKQNDTFEFNFQIPDDAKDEWNFKMYFWDELCPLSKKFNVSNK